MEDHGNWTTGVGGLAAQLLLHTGLVVLVLLAIALWSLHATRTDDLDD